MSGTITHKWDGTVLTVTSDSGTSSADLKGTKGDTGARGVRGLAGADGITSVNGKKGDITLTAADVGAEEAGTAESVRTQIEAWVKDGYLPLSGGTLTGNLGVNGTITAKTYLAVERNSDPQLALKNANSSPLAVLYTETLDGSYGNTHLQVYKSATESNTFTFSNTGNFRAYGNIFGSTIVAQTNSFPQLTLQNNKAANLAMLYANTTTGDYSNAVLRVYSSASEYSSFSFGKDGTFGIPYAFSTVIGEFKSNAWPQMFFRNAKGNALAQLVIPTDNGSYSGLAVNVFSDASTHVEYKFNSDGTFVVPAGITTNGNYISIKNNSYPQLTFSNASGADIGKVFVATTDGTYGGTKIRAYASASDYYDFQFAGNGTFNCATLAPSNALGIAYGGTGATTEAGARSNLGVEYAKYSTAEVDTGNKWIDGKTIYRAVVYGTTSLSNSLGEVGTLPSAVETPVSIRAYAKGDDGAWRVIPNAYHGNSTWDAMIYINGNTIVMSFGPSWTQTRDFVVIVEYTK